MTINREQALEQYRALTFPKRDAFINTIYDSFESQTCDSCAVPCVECPILNAIADSGTIRLVNFGCNQFEHAE